MIIFCKAIVLENVVCEVVAIVFQPQYDKKQEESKTESGTFIVYDGCLCHFAK